jgi:hypothetical protein
MALDALRIRAHRFMKSVFSKRSGTQDLIPRPGHPQPKLPARNERLNPYITNYETKQQKGFSEAIDELVFRKKSSLDHSDLLKARTGRGALKEHGRPNVEVVPVVAGPTFVDDYKRAIAEDIMFVASHMHLPKFPKRKVKEMSGEDIASACANIRWK